MQAAPLARGRAVASAVLSLAGFLVVVTAASDRLVAALTAVAAGVLWAAGMTWLARWIASPPPPLRVADKDLPPATAVWRVLARDVALYGACAAGAVYVALSWRQDFASGFLLGLPVMSWVQQRAAERTERELHGTLWLPAGFTVRSNPVRYLSSGWPAADPPAG